MKLATRLARVEKLLALAGSGGGGGGPIALSGDVTGASNANTAGRINGATVPTIGAIGTVLQVTGVSALSYGLVNLASVTGTLPAGNQAPQNLAGQATGTTAAVVIPLGGQLAGIPASASIQRAPLGPVRFIDPSNVSGLASDSNSGATALLPILTTAHLDALLFFRDLTANTVITYMSDDPGPTTLAYSTVGLGSFNLTFQMTPVVTHTGGTLNAGTIAINPASNQRQVAHTSDLVTFAPFVFGASAHPQRLVDTANGNGAWIVSAATPAAPSMSRPITPGGSSGPLTIGDAYRIQRGGIINVTSGSSPINDGGAAGATGQVFINDAAFGVVHWGINGTVYTRCSFESPIVSGGSFTDCFAGKGVIEIQPVGTVSMAAGVLVTTSSDTLRGELLLDGDIYVTGVGLVVAPDFYASVVVSAATGNGVQLQDCTNVGALLVFESVDIGVFGPLGVRSIVWGSGNTSLGVAVAPGGCPSFSSQAGTRPLVTGAAGDFGFLGEGSTTVTVARAWNDAVGAYTEAAAPASRTTTWAHFAASIVGGGFNFQAHNPATNAAIVGI